MPEPSSSAVAGGAAVIAKFFPGVLGAIVMAMFDPPATKRMLFWQALSAGLGSLLFGGPLVRILDYYAPWVDLNQLDGYAALEWVVPIYFLVGALSWGAFGALARLRTLLKDRAGDAVADRFLK